MSSDSFRILSIDTILCISSDDKQNVNNKNNIVINDKRKSVIRIDDFNSLTSKDEKIFNNLNDEYRSNDDNFNNNNTNNTKNGYVSIKTSFVINGDDINNVKYKQNNKNNKCVAQVAQKCVVQKRVLSSLERRDREHVKARTGYRNIRNCKFRGGILSMLHVLIAVIIYQLLMIERVSGGICWASMQRNGRCKELTAENVKTKEECCATGQGPGTAWSNEDLNSGTLFFHRVLGEGVPCNTCRDTCSGVQCGAGRRCAIRRGRPRCVCAPRCGGGRAGPVCGTDGRSYRSLCRLRKRACRRRARDLTLDYYGHCQDSCAKIRCGSGRHCLLDQDSRAHCVRCTISCPRISHVEFESKAVCGADGVTYSSTCHLRAAACKKGKSIPLAYKGPCDPKASCLTIRCRPRQECLMDWRTDSPRCVTCGVRCPRAKRTLCASNNRTYSSWCHMLREACVTGYVLETKHAGICGAGDLNDFNLVSNEDEGEEDTLNIS